MYSLFYASIEDNSAWLRARVRESNSNLLRLIEIAEEEQDKYDSYWIEDGERNVVHPEL